MDRRTEIFRRAKKQELKDKYTRLLTSKPRVDTGLGFFVDGGRENKDDFYSKWLTMDVDDTTTVKDADNQFQPNITKSQMETIWKSIVANGEAVLGAKWAKEAEIDACTTIEQLKAVEI